MLFWYTKTEYEDIRIPYPEYKQKIAELDLGRLPCVEIDGRKMNESISIFRYFAQKTSTHKSSRIIEARSVSY